MMVRWIILAVVQIMPDVTSNKLDTRALSVHYLRAGSGQPLVLLHGWPEFSGVWRKNIPALAEHFDVIAPDLRKFGKTRLRDAKDETPTTPDVLAEDLADLLDGLGLKSVGIVSHDVGAYAAQAFARRWPERIAGLLFFDCPYPGIGGRWAEPGHLKEIWYQSFHQKAFAAELVGYNRDTCRIYFRHFLSHWAHDPHAFDEDLEAWVDNFMQPGNIQGGFDWYIGFNDIRIRSMTNPAPAVASLDIPTRVLWGASDPVLKAEWSDRLPEFFVDIDVSVIPEAGHFVPYERPDVANAEITRFFRNVFGG
jgi:pimeloyl-ACP methyl ester carboxylesterase